MVGAAIRTIFAQPDAEAVHEQLASIADKLGRQFPAVGRALPRRRGVRRQGQSRPSPEQPRSLPPRSARSPRAGEGPCRADPATPTPAGPAQLVIRATGTMPIAGVEVAAGSRVTVLASLTSPSVARAVSGANPDGRGAPTSTEHTPAPVRCGLPGARTGERL